MKLNGESSACMLDDINHADMRIEPMRGRRMRVVTRGSFDLDS